MKKLAASIVLILTLLVACAAADEWDPAPEIASLYRQVPSSAAFGGAHRVVWRDDKSYSLGADGTKILRSRVLMHLSPSGDDAIAPIIVRFPEGDMTDVSVECASLHDPVTGERYGRIPWTIEDAGGVRFIRFTLPRTLRGQIAAISYTSVSRMQYYLDDLVLIEEPYPVWEKHISIDVPEEMPLYWEALGAGSPTREKIGGGLERHSWTFLNLQARSPRRVIEDLPRRMLFSLQRGSDKVLKTLADLHGTLKAPAMPSDLSRASDLKTFGQKLHAALSSKILSIEGEDLRSFRGKEVFVREGPWTLWEASAIAARWSEQMGHKVRVFWSQVFPVGPSGPGSMRIWDIPVLLISQPGTSDEIYYFPGQSADFGKIDHSIYGKRIYRIVDGEIERITVPSGSAQEHSLIQNWKITMSDSGDAEGRADITITGAWQDVLGVSRSNAPDENFAALLENMQLSLPGFSAELVSCKSSPSSIRLTLDVRAKLGIASGNDLLFRIPACLPKSLLEVMDEGWTTGLRFPFIIEQNAAVSTPKGYKAIMTPGRYETSMSGSSIVSNVDHWPKKRRAEAAFRWVVRKTSNDESFCNTIAEHAKRAFGWSVNPLPIRK